MTAQDAEDELNGLLLATWNTAVAALNPQPANAPIIVWAGKAVPSPDQALIFAVPNFEVVKRDQKTLRNNQTLRLFESSGLFTVSIYAPKGDAAAYRQAVTLGLAIEAAVSKESPSGDIWFQHARATKANGTDVQNQVNVIVTCVYQNQQ